MSLQRPRQPHTYSAGANVMSAELSYPHCHLLGWPLEVRHTLWDIISTSTINNAKYPHNMLTENELRNLSLSCRQIYHEIQYSGYRFVVPWPKLHGLLERPLNRRNIKGYKSLMIEVRMDAFPGYFSGLAAVLFRAQPYLRNLHLFFMGNDQYGRQVYSHGCGSLDREKLGPKLPIDGQLVTELLPLWKRIAVLGRLERLTISSPNFQIFEPMVLVHKPCLEYLYLGTDPRSIAHKSHKAKDLGFLLTLIPTKDPRPPIKVLHIAANATLSSNSLAAKVAESLEHLTWVVPDLAMQNTRSDPHWQYRTAELLLALRMRAHKLETLRICIGGSGLYEDAQNRILSSGFELHLPHLRALKHFEIHMKSKSYWFGKEVVARLPQNLENLYLGDSTLHRIDLLHQLWDRYLVAASNSVSNRHPVDIAFLESGHNHDGRCENYDDRLFESLPRRDEGPWLMTVGPYTQYEVPQEKDDDDRRVHEKHLIYRHKSDLSRLIEPGYFSDPRYIYTYRELDTICQVIGESSSRSDYIPFHGGHLRFVHFEYQAEAADPDDLEFLPSLFTALLINGRLLDRERNKHLAQHDGGKYIPPSSMSNIDMRGTGDETATHSMHLLYSIMLHSLYEIEVIKPRATGQFFGDSEQHLSFKVVDHYFGLEDEAMKVFEQEKVAKKDDLPPYRYPVEKAVTVDGRCHWMSPEAVLADPTY